MDDVPPRGLSQISTRWSSVNDAAQFMLRYAPAVRAYFDALLRPPYDAEDAFQRFCLRVVEKGFALAQADRGRFRDYLKRSVRNFALNYRRDHPPPPERVAPDQLAADDARDDERRWLAEWQVCVLDRAWRALEAYQQEHPGSVSYTVLRLTVDHPDESSDQFAARLSRQTGKAVRADAFRQQLRRARRVFATLVRDEVAQTLAEPTPESIEAELRESGLLPYLRDLLPGDGSPA